jgi:glycosyltransferase involved in cell wall biosynthesis
MDHEQLTHRPLRILLFNLATDTTDPLLGFTTQWIHALAKRVEFVHVVTMRTGRVDVPSNVCVYSVGKERNYSEPRRAVEFYRILTGILRRDRVDACFSHMIPIFTILAAPLLRAKRIPIVTWYAHPDLPQQLKLAHRLSDRMVTSLATSYPYRRDRLTVVGQGIDTDLFSPDSRVVRDDPPLVLCAGRLSPVKDHATLLRAVAKLHHVKRLSFQVVVIGDPALPEDHAYMRSLHQRVRDLQIQASVSFMASITLTELPEWHRRSLLEVNMTPTGSGDKVVLEAMACGTPCLFVNRGFEETAGDLSEGLWFHQGDSDQLAERIAYWMSLSATERELAGVYLRNQVIRLHNVDRLFERLVQLFDDLTFERKRIGGRREGGRLEARATRDTDG